MSETRLEQLFERFRRDGDTGALGEVFDATAGDLLRIARRLTRGRAEAEDLVQATFLAAIERAAKFDSTRALRPWLVGILVRQAGLARRHGARTSELESSLAAADAEPGDAVADREFAEVLARALERLTPADREVLVPLLLDEKRAVQIARELEKRPDTVHMRIHRGLARLRKLLPAGFGLGLVATVLQRRALAQLKREVMNMAHQSIGTVPVASTAAFGASAFAIKLFLGGLCVTATAAVLWITNPWAASPSARPLASPIAPAPEGSTGAASARATLSEPRVPLGPARSAAGSAAFSSAPPSKWVVKGHLNGLRNGETLGSALTVEVVPAGTAVGGFSPQTDGDAGHGNAHAPPITGSIPPEGVFEIDVTALFTANTANPPHELGLTIDNPRYLVSKARILVETGTVVVGDDGVPVLELHRDVDMSLAALVRGDVFAPVGSSSPTCNVSIHRMIGDAPSREPEDVASCISGGEFRLRAAAGASYVLLASTVDSAPATIAVVTSIEEERVLPATHLDAGLAISGTVNAGGAVPAGMPVLAWASDRPADWEQIVRVSFRWTAQGFARISGYSVTDAQGRFTIQGLPAGEFRVVAQGCAVPVDMNALVGDQVPPVTVVAPADDVAVSVFGAVIEFHLIGVDPVPSTVSMSVGEPNQSTMSSGGPWAPVKRIGLFPNRQTHIAFRIEGYEPASGDYLTPGPGEQRVEELRFVHESFATLRVHLTAESGEPISQAAFGFFATPMDGGRAPSRATFSRDAEGTDGDFVLGGIRSGTYDVRIHTGGTFDHYSGYHREAGFHVVLPPDGEETRTQVLSLGGRIRANVVTASSESYFYAKLFDAAGVEYTVQFEHSSVSAEGTSSWGGGSGLHAGANDAYPNLAPGEYRLRVLRDPKTALVLPVTVVAGHTSDVTVDVDAP